MSFGTIIKKKESLVLLSLAGAALMALVPQVSQAGFEWVPGEGAPAVQKDMPAVPHTHGTIEQTPLLTPETAGQASEESQTLQLPAAAEATSQPPMAPRDQGPAQQPVLKMQTVTPMAAPAGPEPSQIQHMGTPSNVSAPVTQMAAPDMPNAPVQTNVIMPADAPDAAMDTVPNSQKLSIDPMPAEMAVAPPAPANSQNMDIVEGFGRDMPLALALQQVVPPEYAYAFDKNVNPGHRVSWSGGKPWDQVVNEMIAPLNMRAQIAGKIVRIHSLEAAMPDQESFNQSGGLSGQASVDENSDMAAAVPTDAPLSLSADQKSGAAIKRSNILDPGQIEYSQETASNESMPICNETGKDAMMGASGETDESGEILQLIESAGGVPAPEKGDTACVPSPLSAELGSNRDTRVQVWYGDAGESLKETLTRWGEHAHVIVEWNAAHDYNLRENVAISDIFKNATEKLVDQVVEGDEQLTWTMVTNPEDPRPYVRMIVEDKS